MQRQLPSEQGQPKRQARPQAPQLAGSVARLLHPAGVWQHACPGAQAPPPLQEHTSGPPAFRQPSPGAQSTPPQRHVPVASHEPPEPDWWQRLALPPQPQRFALQISAPWVWTVQELPQPPHADALVETLSSQPLSAVGAAGIVQLAKPKSQVELHKLPEHSSACTPAVEHALPHSPQWETLLVMSTSQPSSPVPGWGPLQSAKTPEHVGRQVPATQARAVVFVVEHSPPHPPQLKTSFPVLVSQPSLGLSLQSPKLDEQLGTQAPPTHDVEPLGLVQVTPHALQALTLVDTLVSQPSSIDPGCGPLQSAKLPLQLKLQRPPLHTRPVALAVEHGWLHAPQCNTLPSVLISQPVVTNPSQSSNPASHEVIPQTLPLHDPVAFCGSHGVLQAPQCALDVVRSVSQPFARLPSQLPRPAAHGVGSQLLSSHVSTTG